MPRRPRQSVGGLLFHVLNRAVGRGKIFAKDRDYEAFEQVIEQIHGRIPARLLSYCLMPNHWHLVLWPREDGELSEFMRLLTVTHTQRWHAHHQSAGTGPLYQGRFKSFPIEADEHLLTVCRYVERNPLRAGLVANAQDWRWNSLTKRSDRDGKTLPAWLMPQTDWPVDVPARWVSWVNRPQTATEEQALAESIRRGRPFGDDRWIKATAKRLQLDSTLRPRGRPRVRPIEIKDSRPL
jgi:putative transposase